jgi:hypothetical protein
MDLVAAKLLQLVGVERLAERLLAYQRPVGQLSQVTSKQSVRSISSQGGKERKVGRATILCFVN